MSMLLGLLAVCVAWLVWKLRARFPADQGLELHSKSEPYLGMTRRLVGAAQGVGLQFYQEMHLEHKRNGWKPFGWAMCGGRTGVQICSSEDLQCLMNNDFGKVGRGGIELDMQREVYGETNPGVQPDAVKWRPVRAVMTHLYTRRLQRERMDYVFNPYARRVVELMIERSAKGPVDVQEIMFNFSFDTSNGIAFGRGTRCLYGVPRDLRWAELYNDVESGLMYHYILGSTWPAVRALQLTKKERKFQADLKEFNAMLDEAAGDYMNKDGTLNEEALRDGTMSALFLEHSRLDNKETLRQQVRDFIFGILLGGRTTGSALMFTCYLLAKSPEWQAKLYKEALEVFSGDLNRDLTYDDVIDKTPIATAILNESMRMEPVATANMRVAFEDLTFPSGATVKAGQKVFWSFYTIHHNPNNWGDDCDEWKPERWLEGKTFTNCEFNIFSAGPRYCPGREMGVLGALITLLTMSVRFTLSPVEGFEYKEHVSLIRKLHEPGMLVNVHPRAEN